MKYLLSAILLLTASQANAQGFACRASRSATEATICASPDLSRLDERLNRVYARSRVGIYEQRAWLRRRDRCGISRGCIRSAYLRRIEELRD